VLDHVGPFAAIGLRCLLAAAILVPLVLYEGRPRHGAGFKAMALILLTGVSFAAAVTILQIAYGHTTVTNAGFLVNTTTVMMPFAVWALLGYRPPFLVWPAAMAAVAGAYLMSGGGLSQFSYGDGLCLLSAAFYTVWMVFLGEYVRQFGGAGLLSAIQFALTAAICLPLALVFEAPAQHQLLTALPEIVFLGVVGTGIPYLLQGVAQRHTPACEAAIIVSAEALFGATGAFVLLGERLTPLAAVGAAAIATAIVVVQIPPGVLERLLRPVDARLVPAPIRRRRGSGNR